MTVLQIAAIGIITVVAVLIVRNERQDVAIAISIVGGAAVVLGVLDGFTALVVELAEKTGVGGRLVGYLLKIVGAGYIIEFACDTAEDAKLPALANKIAFAGKVVIFCLMLPVVRELINVVVSLSEYC